MMQPQFLSQLYQPVYYGCPLKLLSQNQSITVHTTHVITFNSFLVLYLAWRTDNRASCYRYTSGRINFNHKDVIKENVTRNVPVYKSRRGRVSEDDLLARSACAVTVLVPTSLQGDSSLLSRLAPESLR